MSSKLDMQGTGHTITFIYCPRKIWGFGADVIYLQGKNRHIAAKMSNISFLPSAYIFPINTNHHQLYAGVGVGYARTDIWTPSQWQGASVDRYGRLINGGYDRVGFIANAGYNYKINDCWMIGARFYYESAYLSSISGLLSVGVNF